MTASRSTVSEISIPSVLADFEPWDRVYKRELGSTSRFGRVVAVEAEAILVQLKGRSGTRISVSATDGDKDGISSLSKWNKMPDDALIEIGDIMSTTLPYYVSAPGRREFFTVIEIIPGRKISLRNTEDSKYVVHINGSHSLDEYMQYWELEG